MKVRSILLTILLTVLLITAACKKEEYLIIGDQCPEGTTPVVVVDSDGLSAIECVPVE